MARQRGKVRSQAQWRWMYAAKMPFRKRWSHARERNHGKTTGYRTLPARRGPCRR